MQTNIASKENRRFERVTPESGEPIIVDINGTNFIDILKAGNISLGGVNISVVHGFKGCEIEKQVNLAIKLPDPVNKSFSATGKIKHISGDAFGVNFLSMHKHGEKMLRQYLLYHQKEKSTWKSIRYFCHLF
ncbi:MAG: PilZ domain-containing protein [Gammaproteobacteria bacterium]